MKNLLFATVWLLATLSPVKLTPQTYLTVKGIVLDQSTQAPIPFAHVGIPAQGIGTVTNDQGVFSFNFPGDLKEAAIEISHIGHFTRTIRYEELSSPDSLTIVLRPHAIQLQGVEVLEAEYPLSFYVEKAIQNLNKNYPSKLHFMSGFYREAKVNEETLRYDRLIEAALDIQDKGLRSSRDNIRIHIRELRKSDDFSKYSELNDRLKARFGDRNKIYDLFFRNPIRSYQNEETPLSLKYNPLELMKSQQDKLRLREVTYKDKTKIYIIDYEDRLFSGTLYIDSEDYGIHRLEFYTDLNFKRARKSAEGEPVPIDRTKAVGINKEIFLYQKVNGTYHLSLVRKTSFDDFLDGQQKSDDRVISYAIRTLMINDFHTSKKEFDRIKWKEAEKKDIALYDIEMPYNEEFWTTYNVLRLEPLSDQIKNDLEWATRLEEQFRQNGKARKK